MPDMQSPLWKQILGAVLGVVCALTLYSGYEMATPHLSAWLTIPATTSGDPVDVAGEVSGWELNHIAARAREIAAAFGTQQETASQHQAAPMAVGTTEATPPAPASGAYQDAPDPFASDVERALYSQALPSSQVTATTSTQPVLHAPATPGSAAAPDPFDSETEEALYSQALVQHPSVAVKPSPATKTAMTTTAVGQVPVAAHAGAPKNLPNSGIGLWASLMLTFVGSLAVQYRRKVRSA